MELVTRLVTDGSRMLAVGVGTADARTGYELDALGQSGLPDAADARRRAEVDFEKWEVASIAEYAAAFGLSLPGSTGHEAWSFHYNSIRYVVPALALMRALFRPNHHVLAMLPRPQSLEDACTYAGAERNEHVALLGTLRDWSYSRERASIVEPLSWMYCFPSARAAWTSAGAALRAGRFSLQLPNASARMVLHGRMHAQNFYVTRLVFVSVTAQEAPLEFASDHSRTICFHVMDETMARGFKRTKTKDDSIGLRDGEFALSDAEWDAVKPIVVRDGGRKGFKHDPRAIVDAILAKQCQGSSWIDTVYPPGIHHTTACVAFCRWQKDGRWSKVLEVLRQRRANE